MRLGVSTEPRNLFVERSSADICGAVCIAMKEALSEANATPSQVDAIGVDATCSLAAITAMVRPGGTISSDPAKRDYHDYHDAKYRVFLDLYGQQRAAFAAMAAFC